MTEPTPELLAGLEAILMVIDQPVTVEQLSDGLGIEPDEAAGALAHLAAEYDGEHDGREHGGQDGSGRTEVQGRQEADEGVLERH